MKQEESERRKSEEKARRDAIFKQYLNKKEEEEEGVKPRPQKAKPRPKSMFVKAGPGGGDYTEGRSSLLIDSSLRNSSPLL